MNGSGIPLIKPQPKLVPLGFSSIPVPQIKLAAKDSDDSSGEARETY